MRYASIAHPIEVCLVGGGAFGQSLLAQARFIAKISARIVVDLTAEAAAHALLSAGWSRDSIVACTTTAEARRAWADGSAVAAGSLEVVMDLPFAILVEATGHPEAAARHCLSAIGAKRHVVLVTKETDSVAGPMLARLAREAGVGVTPVDGDQPSLLIDLVTWGETLGFDIVCAGKSSEYDFVFDPSSGAVTSNGVTTSLPDLRGAWASERSSVRDTASRRASLLAPHYRLRTVPDLCEMTVVANATGLGPDFAPFHAPVARIPEVAGLFGVDTNQTVLSGMRRIDVFHHLRLPDEASFAGGVFIVVRCQDATSWGVLTEKGHAVSPDGSTAMLYLPRHLLGVEAATSLLDLAGLGLSGYGPDYQPRYDLVAVATRDIPAGELLAAKGHHHTIDGVAGEMRPMSPLSDDVTTPYYLVANRKLARSVRAGDAIRFSDLEIGGDAPLLELRRQQDSVFRTRLE